MDGGGITYDGSFTKRKSRTMRSVLDGPTILMKNRIDGTTQVPKYRKEWNVTDKLVIQNNAKSRKILICGIGPDEYNRISSCQDASNMGNFANCA